MTKTTTKNQRNYLWISFITIPVIFFADFFTKKWAVANVSNVNARNYFGIINLILVHNNGAAWNIGAGRLNLIVVITAVVLFALFLFMLFNAQRQWVALSIAMIVGGGLGNLIDRIINEYVIDFIQFAFWQKFPVFNVADIFVTIGSAILIFYVIFSSEIDETRHFFKSTGKSNRVE